jgi:hypothetical protein
MAIQIPLAVGNPDAVFADLVDIVRCDAGLTASEPTLFARQVAYSQKQQAVPSSTRILEIINSPINVYISGMGYNDVIPGVGAISASAGLHRARSSPEVPISIWYDITDAAGQHWTVKDKDSQNIHLPRPVLLYHELAHAWHDIQGDLPAVDHDAEVQAIADENVFRAQLGLSLRNSTSHRGGVGIPDHGGLTFPKCSAAGKGWSPGWKCPKLAAVATAALESPNTIEIAALRRARAEYRHVSLWGTLIAQPALDLYGKFGPHLARAMQQQPALREAMLWFVVRPTFHLLTVAEAYLAAETDTPALTRTVDAVLQGYVNGIASTRWSAAALRDAADDAKMAAGMLASGAAPSARPDFSNPPDHLFSNIGREILAVNGPRPAAFAWGFEGLAAFLQSAAQRIDGSPSAADALLSSMAAWVARIPLPPPSELRVVDMRHELTVLASRIFTRADTRLQFARHLLSHWTGASSSELEIVLDDLGYLDRVTSEVHHG